MTPKEEDFIFALSVVEECLSNMLHFQQVGDKAALDRGLIKTRNYIVDVLDPTGEKGWYAVRVGRMAKVRELLGIEA